jgi:molecular chaperone HtpG
VKKVLATLEEMKRDKPDEYLAFWSELGPVVKEGLVAYDAQDKDKLLELVVAPSTVDKSKPTSLDDYVARMKEGQDSIYFLVGATKEAVAKSPLLESFVAKGYEVLLFSDPIDELWLEQAPRYKDKQLVSIGRGTVELPGEAKADEEKQKTYGDLLTCLRVHLQEEIKEVRLSNRLTSSAACIVGDEHDLSPRMQRMLEQWGQAAPKVKRILELNPDHPLLPKLQAMFVESKADPRLELYAKLLLGQAQLAESGQVSDPVELSRLVVDLMVRAS